MIIYQIFSGDAFQLLAMKCSRLINVEFWGNTGRNEQCLFDLFFTLLLFICYIYLSGKSAKGGDMHLYQVHIRRRPSYRFQSLQYRYSSTPPLHKFFVHLAYKHSQPLSHQHLHPYLHIHKLLDQYIRKHERIWLELNWALQLIW